MSRVQPLASIGRARFARAVGASSLMVISIELILILIVSQVTQHSCATPGAMFDAMWTPANVALLA